MGWNRIRAGVVVVLAILAALLTQPALAKAFPAGSTCHATVALDEDHARLAATPTRWICDGSDWSIKSQRAIIRFDLRGMQGPPPQVYSTRLTGFEHLNLTVLAADGSVAASTFRPDDMTRATWDWVMSAPLPQSASPPVAVIVTIDGARHAGMLSDSALSSSASPTERQVRMELLVALICGTLILPLVFNVAFYRVLRERFLLWHAVLVLCMIVQTVVTSGLINRIADLPFAAVSLLSVASWGGGVTAAAFFAGHLIEPDKLDPVHRRLLRLTAPWVAFWSVVYLYAGGAMRPFASTFYYASFLPVLGLFVWIMALAWLRGGRSVNFMIIAWLPIMATGLMRVASALGLTPSPMEFQFEQHVAIALEVVITSLGVADRFMVIRRQRDTARAQARLFESLAESDPLTGLLNRRAIETQFPALQAEGFHTMAVIDLDNFKQINDAHGHAVGDQVLRVVAQTLAADGMTIAARMGGEEFMILLQGEDAAERAERCRQALPTRIAAEVPGLQQMVTASMGLLERRCRGGFTADFDTVYAHCDRLLYEAKDAGRNRAVCERVQSFSSDHAPARAVA